LQTFFNQARQARPLLSRKRLGISKELVIEVKSGLHSGIIQISVPVPQAPPAESVNPLFPESRASFGTGLSRGGTSVGTPFSWLLMPNVRAKDSLQNLSSFRLVAGLTS